jgi:hypothetical protein
VYQFCNSHFLYAAHRRVAGRKPARFARRSTPSMLLTLPSEVRIASWAVLRDSWNDLFTRLNLIDAKDPSLGDRGKKALAALHEYFCTTAPPVKPKGGWKVLYPRDDHADHWHVSYDPDDVDDDALRRTEVLAWVADNRARFFPADKLGE